MSDALPPLRDVIARHDLAARKRLGQHFLLDLNLTGRIARAAAPLESFTIVEVGPGPGGLTRALLAEGAPRVIAVERDRRCVAALRPLQDAFPGRLLVIEADALAIDLGRLAAGPAKLVANLPYNIATALLIGWLTGSPWYASMTLLFQKEVAERITARAGTRAYGRLSVLTQWRTHAEQLFDIHPRAFIPAPKVTSSLVRFVPRPAPEPDCSAARLERVTAAAFGQRRKMLRQSLRSLAPDPEALLARAGIEPTLRAEQLEIGDFCRLARSLE